jgi:hypothetical protein
VSLGAEIPYSIGGGQGGDMEKDTASSFVHGIPLIFQGVAKLLPSEIGIWIAVTTVLSRTLIKKQFSSFKFKGTVHV